MVDFIMNIRAGFFLFVYMLVMSLLLLVVKKEYEKYIFFCLFIGSLLCLYFYVHGHLPWRVWL